MENIINKNRFTPCTDLTKEKLDLALKKVMEIVDINIEAFADKLPVGACSDGVYTLTDNTDDWTQGFWPGILWNLYQLTGDEKYKKAGLGAIDSFYNRIEQRLGVEHHDMGFLYSLSCVAAYRLAGDEKAKKAALMASDALVERYREKGEFIQAWGSLETSKPRMIIDCLLNIPLLFWASEETGEASYADIAYKHFNTTVKHILRDDGSTFHTFFFDGATGEPLHGATAQGASDDSIWSRGQAWGVYGSVLTYLYKENPHSQDMFKKVSNVFLNRLPEDYVCYWDLIFKEADGEERDSSSAAIAACGLLAGAGILSPDDEDKELYKNAAMHMVNSLIDGYIAQNPIKGGGIVEHGVYAKPMNRGIDECSVWGDYFFVEALARIILGDEYKLLW